MARSIIVSMIGMFIATLPILAYVDYQEAQRINGLVSPLPSGVTSIASSSDKNTDVELRAVSPTPGGVASINDQQQYDIWVGQYVDQYFTSPTQRSEARMIIQCLLHRETKHYTFTGQGDNGLAKGILQWHDATWIRARKEMIKQGYASELGWSQDPQTAIDTTVWALKQSAKPRKDRVISILEWGPVLRDSQGSDFATCPVPSFYQK